MDLQHAAQEQAFALVSSYLKQSFGDLAQAEDDEPSVAVDLARRLWVSVYAMGDEDASVRIYNWVGQGIAVTDEVAQWLLRTNLQYRFGSLGLDDDGDILFQHVLPSHGLTKPALARVTHLMSLSIKDIDDELHMRSA